MMVLQEAWARLLSWFRKRRLDREFEEEPAAHIEMATEDHVAHGQSLAEARRLALVKLGGVEGTNHLHRDTRGLPRLTLSSRTGGMQSAR
jgi:hypothetical protein